MDELEVFVSSHQNEFSRKRKRLEKLINDMKYLRCRLLESRGADTVDKKKRSTDAVRECDIYVGIFGQKYSHLAQEECVEALNNNKRNLIYILDGKKGQRDPRVNLFITNVLTDRITYFTFKTCKQLESQIEEDLNAQMVKILRTGLDMLAQVKSEMVTKENLLKTELSNVESFDQKRYYLLEMANMNYRNGDYTSSLVNISIFIEFMLRHLLSKLNKKDYNKVPYHILIKQLKKSGMFDQYLISNLEEFRIIRNRALHEGLIPSKSELTQLIKITNWLQIEVKRILENSNW